MSSIRLETPLSYRVLYTEPLYLIEEKIESKEIAQTEFPQIALEEADGEFTYLGENNQYILVIVNEKNSSSSVLSSETLVLLEKILSTRKLTLRDVAVLNLDKYPNAKFDDLKHFFACSKMIGMGVAPTTIGLPNDTRNIQFEFDGVRMFFSYALSEMVNPITDKERKVAFWNLFKNF